MQIRNQLMKVFESPVKQNPLAHQFVITILSTMLAYLSRVIGHNVVALMFFIIIS